MKKIIIEVPEKYGDVMSMTFVGRPGTSSISATTGVYDLRKGTNFIVPETGPWIQRKIGESDQQRDQKRARWINLTCTECGQFDFSKPNFCPNCGAYMKEGDSE